MFKRVLSLILALMTLLILVPAEAESSFPAEIYRIVLREPDGDVTLGSGVLFGTKTTLLTASACWAEGEMYAIGADGEHMISYRGEVIGTQLITLGLATESAAEPVSVTGADYLLDYKLYGVAADGSFISMDVRGSRVTRIDGRREALLYASEGLMPGAIMFGDDFGLACVALWQSAEGEGAYAAVADVTLLSVFGEGGSAADARLLQGFTAVYENGEITVDWSKASGYTMNKDTVITVYSTVTGNPYLTRDEMTDGETSTTFPAIPETEVMFWIVASQGEPEETLYPEYADNVQFVNVPAALPFSLYGLKNLRCGVTPGEPGHDGVATDFLPQEPLTRETLSDRSRPIYFQTEDVYTADREDDNHSLMLTLYTPEGYAFYYYSGYVFMPEMNQSDLWISDISEIFADYERFCEGEAWPAGEYTFLYTIDGGEVARFSFTLE